MLMNNELKPLQPINVPQDQPVRPESQFDNQQNNVPPANPPEPIQELKTSKKKILVAALAMLVLVGASTALYLSRNNNSNQPTSQTNRQLTLPNQPKQLNDQFSTQYFAAGYVNYEPAKFKAIDTTLPKLQSVVPPKKVTTEKQVIFMSDLSYKGPDDSRRLLMYDVASQKTYIVAQDNSIGGYSNAKIMSNHYIVYVTTSQSDPLTSNTAIKSVDLNTGKSQTIMENSNLPASLCCSVSPDGLRLVIPQTNKFMIYQAGETKPVEFSANVEVFPKVEGNDNDNYAASQRNYGYPTIVWLNDDKFMFAKSHPLKWAVDSQGSHALINNNGLAIYDLTTGTGSDVARTSDIAIKWFTTDGNAVIFAGYMPNVSGVTDKNSGMIIYKIDDFTDPDSQPLELVSQPDYQSTLAYDLAEKQLYIQPSAPDQYGDLNGGPSKTLQKLDAETGKDSSTTIKGFDFPGIEGVIGPHKLVVNNSVGTSNDYNIYDVQSGTSEHILSAITSN